MRVFMLGWEFPPFFSGGLGIACFGLTRALAEQGVRVTFVMPYGPPGMSSPHARILIANNLERVDVRPIPSLLVPYMDSESYDEAYRATLSHSPGPRHGFLYGHNIFEEVERFARKVAAIASVEEFDLIHAHDWMTYPAAIAAKQATGRPLVVHIHNTCFDRGGDNPNSYEYQLERAGFEAADRVLAISGLVRDRIIRQYGIPAEKVEVVYNGLDPPAPGQGDVSVEPDDRIVLFLGRVTLQKGPDYFVEAARLVLDKMPHVKFVMAGTGDMLPRMIRRVAELNMSRNFFFTGFVNREEGDRLYRAADLFVMPSVSEPFGLVPLEALQWNTPVIISKQSGVSEVLHHALKVDFWDVRELANKILSVLSYSTLQQALAENGAQEARQFNWGAPAAHCRRVYGALTGRD